MISSQPRYDRFDTSPYIQTSAFRSAEPLANRGIETRDVTITIQFELPDFPCGSKGVQGIPDQLTVIFIVSKKNKCYPEIKFICYCIGSFEENTTINYYIILTCICQVEI